MSRHLLSLLVLAVGCSKPAVAPEAPVAAAPALRTWNTVDEALSLATEECDILGVLHVSAMLASPIGQTNRHLVDVDSLDEPVFALGSACGVGFETWNAVALAFDTSTDGGLLFFSAPGIGRQDTLRCIAREGGNHLPGAVLELETVDGRHTITDAHDGDAIVALSDEVIVVTTKAFKPVLEARIDAAAPSPPALLRAMDLDATLALGVSANDDLRESMPSLVQMTISASIDDSLSASASGRFDDPADVQRLATALQHTLDQYKPMASVLGVPPTLLQSVAIETTPQTLSVRASATADELVALRTAMKALLGESAPEEDPTQPAL